MWPVCLLLFPSFDTPQASHSHAMVTLSALCLLSVPSSISICCVCFQSLISATITITTTTTGDHSQQGWLSYINTIIVSIETESWERRDHLPLDKWQQIGAASSAAAAMNVQTTIIHRLWELPIFFRLVRRGVQCSPSCYCYFRAAIFNDGTHSTHTQLKHSNTLLWWRWYHVAIATNNLATALLLLLPLQQTISIDGG